MNLDSVPSLDEIAANPARAAGLEPATTQALLGRCIGALNALYGRLLASRAREERHDELLNVTDAAHRLGQTEDWLYRHAGELPFTVRVSRSLRFSAKGLERWIRNREGERA